MPLLILALALSQLAAVADGTTCLPGQGRARGGGCIPCSDRYYQDSENYSKCKVCRKCNEASGSQIISGCTKLKNTVCRCQPGFSTLEEDFVTCQCDAGSGLKQGENGSKWLKCEPCPAGHFSGSHDSTCVKWKECKSGVKMNGSATSDAICNEESASTVVVTPLPTSGGRASTVTPLNPKRPQEGARTQRTFTTSTAGGSGEKKMLPTQTPSTGNHIGTAVLMCGIVGLLLLTAATCRLHITLCERKPRMSSTDRDSYRRPVEESGDSPSTSLKHNPEEP